jgi:PKD repeat protein
VYEYAAPGTGCFNRDTLVLEIKLPDPVNAGPDQVLCVDAGEQILTNFIPADGDWSGNGMQATEPPSFDPAIAGEGSHQLRLTTGIGTCLVEDYRQITVIDLSSVNPGPDLSVCASWEPFFLQGASPAGGTWKGDGVMNPQSGLFDPSKADIGTNKIFYTYKDPNSGCQVVKTRIITVNPIAAASFVAPDVACINELITFENQSPSNYKCSWDFGNGKTSNVFSPFHRYAEPGTYTINLFVSNQYGCTDTTSREIVITEAPTANFEPDTNAICSGLEVKFDNKSSGYSAKFSWDFGNGSTSTAINPGMVFYNSNNRDTTYIITLVASNRCGNSMHQLAVKVVPSPEANFLLEKNNGCSPLTINFANITTGNALAYYWDLGNGSFSNQAVPPSQTYWAGLNKRLYTITLIATNTCGRDTLKQILEVLPSGAEAGFTPSTLLGCAPLTVNFANKASATAKVDYDFGDGNTSAEANPVHVFTKPGNYTVMQYASTHCGYDTAIYVIKVVAPPVVKFTHNTIACAGDTVSFKNNSSNLSGFSWDFGDGFNSGLNNPQHVFSAPGTYTVTLTGSALFNQCEGSYSSKVTVKELPKAIFEADAKTGCTPFKVNFKPVAPQPGWYYTWDFGDGNTAVSDAPQHAFITPGTYDVKLQVVDESGCKSDSTIYNFVANPTPSAVFSFENKERCTLPAIVNFKNESTGAAGYTWYMGDGTTNVFNAPTHRYNKAGEYGVTMIASNQFNCMDTIQQSIKVYEKPVAKVDIDSYEGCSPMTVVLGNQSTGVNQYFWDFGNGKTSTEKHPTLVYQKPGTYKLRLIASADNVCIDTFDLNGEIIVREGPVANFDVEEVINGGGTGIFKFFNKSKGALTSIWEISDGSIYTDTDIEHRFFNNGAQVVRLTISGNYGCVDDTVMTITPTFIKGLFTPNGFSPENGIGDVKLFKPKGAGLKEYHLQIYSPYGMLLWESTELSGGEPSEGWDGTYKGVLLPQDVYVWKIKAVFDDGTVWRGIPTEAGGYKTMGSVILLR